jgi:hypothetical protein
MSLVVLLILSFSMTLSLVISLHQYRLQKTDSLSEFQIQKLRVTESRLKDYLTRRQESAGSLLKVKPSGSKNNAEFKDFWEGGEELTYITDIEGKLIASNSDSFEGANLKRALQSTAKSLVPSNQSSSVLLENSAFEHSIVAYSVLEGTNLVIFVESNAGGRFRLLRPMLGSIMFALIFLIFMCVIMSEVLSNRFSNYLANLVAVFDETNSDSNPASITPLSSEFAIIETHFAKLSSFLKEKALQASMNEIAKSALESFMERLNENPDDGQLHKEIALFLKKVISQHLRLTISLYEFDGIQESFSGTSVFSRITKMNLMRSGIPAEVLLSESALSEGWKTDDTIKFSKNWRPELITETEVRFPIAHDTHRVFFLLVSGSGIKNMPKADVQWIVLACSIYGLSLPLSIQTMKEVEFTSAI